MRYFLPGNRLPRSYTFKEVEQAILDAGKDDAYPESQEVGMGPKTVAFRRGLSQPHNRKKPVVIVEFRGLQIIAMDDEKIQIDDEGFHLETVRRRMDAALQGIGKRLVGVDNVWKVYTIDTGEYVPYQRRMTVRK